MDLQTSIADDFATVVDWLKPITIESVSLDALRRAVSTREIAASNGRFLKSDTFFHFETSKFPTRPIIGGSLTDVDGDWTIVEVDKQTLVNRWRCRCRQLYIADISANRVTIQSATYAKGTTGAEEPTWSNVATNVLADVRLDRSSVEQSNISRNVESTVLVRFASAQDFTAASRIITSTGTVLKVLSWDGFNTVEQFFTATCEVSIWPQS